MSSKVFLDTCIWVELCLVSTSSNSVAIQQQTKATNLLDSLRNNDVEIITLKEQFKEIFQVIFKAKIREYKIGDLKQIRNCSDYAEQLLVTKQLCFTVYNDMKHLVSEVKDYEIDLEFLLEKIDIVDPNDLLYYDFCRKESLLLYTFDKGFQKLNANNIVVL